MLGCACLPPHLKSASVACLSNPSYQYHPSRERVAMQMRQMRNDTDNADRFASMLIGKIWRMAIPNRNCLSPPSYHPSCKARVILSVTSKPVDKLHGLNDFCMGAAAFSSKICIYPSPTSNTPSNPPSKLHCPLYSPLCFALS